jgi:hypothetical protein
MKRNVSFAAAVTAAAAATAAALWLAVPAGVAAASRPAASGTEHFQLMIISPAINTGRVIVSGVFTAGGTEHVGAKVDTLVFPTGTFKAAHAPGVGGTVTLNHKTCLYTARGFHGAITLSGGTGAYAGIGGTGTYHFSELAILARSGGKCTLTKPPVSAEILVKSAASVSL